MNISTFLVIPRTSVLTAVLLLFVGLVTSPLQAQNPPPFPHLIFHVELGGSEAIPAANTDAKGLITFIFTPDRKKVNVSGMLVRLEGTVTEAKIRLGITGQTGSVLLDFMPLINGRHIIGQLDVTPALLQNLLINGVYAEVRTTAHPSGEMRGQFVCETDLDFSCMMRGNQALPPNNSNAIAFGGIHYPLGASDIVYAFTMRGLSSAITSVAIYEGPPSQIGSLVTELKMAGGLVQGLILLDTMDPEFLRKAREGLYDIVVKTVNFPNGEIQGKIKHIGYFASLAPVNGVQQVPAVPTQGFGFSTTTPNGTLDSLTTTIFINTVMPTSVKIHIGNPGQVGPELIDMGLSNFPGLYTKKYKITEGQLTDFVQGRLYINVTTTAFPNGELRGVMKNTLRKAYAFDLCGAQVVPPTNSDALGIAVASVDQANCYLNYKVITDGLAGDPTGAFAAEGAFGTNGIAFHDMPDTEPIIAGSHEIMAVLGPIIEAAGTYIQISTPGFPNGEIRGQIKRGFTCPEVVVAVTDLDNLSQVVVSPVPFQDVLNIDLASASGFKGRLVMRDILGVLALMQPVEIIPGEQTLQIQTGNLPKGVYMLSLEIPGQDADILLKKVLRVE